MNSLKNCSKLILILFFYIVNQSSIYGEENPKVEKASKEEMNIKNIFEHTLTKGKGYGYLRRLCKEASPRLSGSEGANKAVELMYSIMKTLPFDRVEKQEVMVPHWVRGKAETGIATIDGNKINLNICALGGSIGTGKEGIKSKLVVVNSLEELKALGKEKIKGNIVMYNYPMQQKFISTFSAYGDAVWQRGMGANEASKLGAVACLVRSMNMKTDLYPHTGAMRKYVDTITKIPAAAISTQDADLLQTAYSKLGKIEISIQMNCGLLPDVMSHNVIGEIKGTEFPNEIITIGGHLDAWDLAEGAHDDGAGCVQSIQAALTMMELGIKPKRTIRVVMFMNEENGMKGGLKYTEMAKEKNEQHYAAIESDAGGFSPRGFGFEGEDFWKFQKFQSFGKLLEPYGCGDFKKGHGGVDISPLANLNQNTPLIGLDPDSQRYFDYHHAKTDVFEAVNERELNMGAAAMSSLLYLISNIGW